jgi:hypothetical protein
MRLKRRHVLTKIKSERDARAAEELSRFVAACSKIYHSTIDKKIRDLTVREEEQVKHAKVYICNPHSNESDCMGWVSPRSFPPLVAAQKTSRTSLNKAQICHLEPGGRK